MELAVFPLNTVLFPGGVLPLRIFETRYLDMVRRCMREDQPFGVCLMLAENPGLSAARVCEVGTWGRIVDWEQRSDGLLGITVMGEQRFRIGRSWTQPDGLNMADVEELHWPDEVTLPREYEPLAGLLHRLLQELPEPYRLLQGDLQQAGWVSARLSELLPLELPQKQMLLEMDNHLNRLQLLRETMLGDN